VSGKTYDVGPMYDAIAAIVLLVNARLEDVDLDEDEVLDEHDGRLVARLLVEQFSRLLAHFPQDARAAYLATLGQTAVQRPLSRST
jgi:hypothetical protein